MLKIIFSVLCVTAVTAQYDEVCFDEPDRYWPHETDCGMYIFCTEDNILVDGVCPPETPVFDTEWLTCEPEAIGICTINDDEDNYPDDNYPDHIDEECPLDADQPIFFPAEQCDEYYLCVNGNPVLMQCRDGQHWNDVRNYCDDPHTAGCDDTAQIPSLPTTCAANFVGSMPHPSHCNWFIYCSGNGSSSIQQCPHLFHFDVNQNRCLFMSIAVCVKDKK